MGYLERRAPYPLRAMRISVSFRIFPQWRPSYTYKRDLTELAKADGVIIWWASWLWVQISYNRWVEYNGYGR